MERRSGIKIMGQLIGLVKPLLHIMVAAIVLGIMGYLCAIFLTIFAGTGLTHILMSNQNQGMMITGFGSDISIKTLGFIILILAVLRGVLHYGEQACNHFIAFKLLAIIRHRVFDVLRKLAPAKLEGKDKGNLISILTSDIELLEVFYAHTISPIVIAFFTSAIMVFFIGQFHFAAGIFAALGYIGVGIIVPLWNGTRGKKLGMEFRNNFGDMNSFVLESLRGLDETIQYGQGKKRMEEMKKRSERLGGLQKKLNRLEGVQRAVTDLVISVFSFGMLFFMIWLYQRKFVDFEAVVVGTIAMMGSFGPVVALSSLSNNLNQTLASGERVLSLLEEKPQVETVSGERKITFSDAGCEKVCFSYDDKPILQDVTFLFPKGKIMGIHGRSGCGKSTLLKLMMRFWDPQKGNVFLSGEDIKKINTSDLREMEAYVTQETYLFHDSIASNIEIGKTGASREEIIEAAKKASIHDFIQTLPKGYDTSVGELGDTLSGGERQRIGIARAFLHDAPFLLLDEPTSNLDSLNEGIILKSLKETCREKTVILVSHRESTMKIADVVYSMENGKND